MPSSKRTTGSGIRASGPWPTPSSPRSTPECSPWPSAPATPAAPVICFSGLPSFWPRVRSPIRTCFSHSRRPSISRCCSPSPPSPDSSVHPGGAFPGGSVWSPPLPPSSPMVQASSPRPFFWSGLFSRWPGGRMENGSRRGSRTSGVMSPISSRRWPSSPSASLSCIARKTRRDSRPAESASSCMVSPNISRGRGRTVPGCPRFSGARSPRSVSSRYAGGVGAHGWPRPASPFAWVAGSSSTSSPWPTPGEPVPSVRCRDMWTFIC